MQLINKTDKKKWNIQPVLYKKSAGFVKDDKQLRTLIKEPKKYAEMNKTIKIFSDNGLLKF